MPEIINIENVSYSYPGKKEPALEEVSLSVHEGEFLAIMGENGSGKTTLCGLVNGIIPHFFGGKFLGTVIVDGERADKSSVPSLALKAGMVLDDPDTQLFTSSARHEAAFGPENLLLPVEEIERRVEWALGAVGLDGFQPRPPSTLSGGEKQRLAIAAALTMNGKILVLDEPLCRLDPQGSERIMSVLKDIREKYGTTIIMASHDSGMTRRYADRVCVLRGGRVAAIDTTENIFADSDLLERNGIQPLDEKNPQSREELFFEDSSRAPPETQRNSAIEIKNLSFSYPNGEGIENINLSIYENDFMAITGRNGCGKTTLLKNITGLLPPSRGDILIRGKSVKDLSVSSISREIGFVTQNPDNQLFTGSVYDEVTFALNNLKLSKTEKEERARNALNVVGLEDVTAFPRACHRADRTKIIIACVIAMDCKIIILDEADIGQDYRGNKMIMDLAGKLRSMGYTIIFVTHNMALVNGYADRLIIMERNGIVMDRARSNFYER